MCAARLFVLCSGRQTRVFLYLGPPRSANVVILRGERRNSGKLNAPSAFRSCKLVPTLSISPAFDAGLATSIVPDIIRSYYNLHFGDIFIAARMSVSPHCMRVCPPSIPPAFDAAIDYVSDKERELRSF